MRWRSKTKKNEEEKIKAQGAKMSHDVEAVNIRPRQQRCPDEETVQQDVAVRYMEKYTPRFNQFP